MPRATMRPPVSPGENDIEGCRAFHLLSESTTKGPTTMGCCTITGQKRERPATKPR